MASLNGISIPLIDKVAGTPKMLKGFSIPLVRYCIRVVDQGANPIQNAIVTLTDGLASEQYISDVDGFVFVFIKSSTANAQKAAFGDGFLVYDFTGQEDTCLDIQLTAITGLATQLESQTLPTIQSALENDFCYCSVECTYIETAFAKVGGAAYKNDKASFLFQKLVSGDSLEYELYKDSIKVADLNDNTYGTLYDGFTSQPLYKGFIIEWEKVLSLSGSGIYQIKLQRNILGSADTVESRVFRLLPYSDEYADGTVKIEAIQTGNLVSSSLDFSDLLPDGWPIYLRVDGRLQKINPEYIEENYLDSRYNLLQRQNKLIGNFELKLLQAPAEVINLFLDGEISLANNIKVTDYHLFNTEILRDVELYTKEPQYEPIFGNRLQDFTMTLVDKLQNKFKQNH